MDITRQLIVDNSDIKDDCNNTGLVGLENFLNLQSEDLLNQPIIESTSFSTVEDGISDLVKQLLLDNILDNLVADKIEELKLDDVTEAADDLPPEKDANKAIDRAISTENIEVEYIDVKPKKSFAEISTDTLDLPCELQSEKKSLLLVSDAAIQANEENVPSDGNTLRAVEPPEIHIDGLAGKSLLGKVLSCDSFSEMPKIARALNTMKGEHKLSALSTLKHLRNRRISSTSAVVPIEPTKTKNVDIDSTKLFGIPKEIQNEALSSPYIDLTFQDVSKGQHQPDDKTEANPYTNTTITPTVFTMSALHNSFCSNVVSHSSGLE